MTHTRRSGGGQRRSPLARRSDCTMVLGAAHGGAHVVRQHLATGGCTMRSFLAVAVAVLVACTEAAGQRGRQDVDVIAADGAKLRATSWSLGKPGPAMLLLHQCNMDRRAWTQLGAALAERGVHVMAMDYRGYGES